MAKKPVTKLDWLAEQVVGVLHDQGLDAAYIEDIEATLAGNDRFAVLIWCNNLDSGNKSRLANRLNISETDLLTTLKTLQKM